MKPFLTIRDVLPNDRAARRVAIGLLREGWPLPCAVTISTLATALIQRLQDDPDFLRRAIEDGTEHTRLNPIT